MTASLVDLLCSLTSTACSVLLLQKYRSSRLKLLFWSALGFLGLAVGNTLLFVDHLLGDTANLSVVRTVPGALGLLVMIWGFVWDTG
jgi:hypothetical protein